MDHATLKADHRDTFSQPLALSIHRVLSWLQRLTGPHRVWGDPCYLVVDSVR